jgi:acyl-CoA synthetase (AMP-forming)/AMP-acid ligase II
MRRFSLPKYLDCIQRFQITEIPIVPPILLSILHSPLATADMLASLRCIWCAGAPLDKALQSQFASMLAPEASMTQLWGMTETAYITAFLHPERDDSGSVGRLLPNVQAKYVPPRPMLPRRGIA